MVDRETLKQAARYRTNEHGQRVVEIPAELWEEWVTEDVHGVVESQKDKILALLDEWDATASDLTDEWWDDFQEFLKTHRLDLSR